MIENQPQPSGQGQARSPPAFETGAAVYSPSVPTITCPVFEPLMAPAIMDPTIIVAPPLLAPPMMAAPIGDHRYACGHGGYGCCNFHDYYEHQRITCLVFSFIFWGIIVLANYSGVISLFS